MKTPILHISLALALFPMVAISAPYTVKSGDNLYQIARKNGISVQALQKANPRVNPKALQAGQVINLPSSQGTVAKTSPAKARVNNVVTGSYTVAAGDNLGKIASRNGTSVASLRAANPNLDPQKLQVGQKIKLTGSRPVQQIAKAPSPSTRTKEVAQASISKPKPAPSATIAKQETPKATSHSESTINTLASTPEKKETSSQMSNTSKDLVIPASTSTVVANNTSGAGIGDVTPISQNNTPQPQVAAETKSSQYRLIKTTREQTLADVATENKTTSDKLNSLNGWSFSPDTLLAVDSELYVPAQP